ncbi:MAG TPA: tetratricopeptide repeat protein [Candidatus Polarisedimenticolaceae bacterium]|nr:tetratricopeptide repeat protein [Candidatus Polarisedimenticolaceae bacterium]
MSRGLRHGLILTVTMAAAACRHASPPLTFVGRSSCEGCHAAEAARWRGSHHDRAMQVAGPDTVLGDFDGATFTHFGVTTTFLKKEGKFVARTDGPDGALHDYEIAYTFGVDPLQQYLIRFPDGRIQALNVCWDTRSRRWFHLYPNEPVPHDDILHWTGIYQNWNDMCAECHSTGVVKGYDRAKDTFQTTFSEIDVSCEACHGPGSRHVALKGNGGLVVTLQDPATWIMDATTGIAKRSQPRALHTEVEACGRCHARRGVVSRDYVYGRPLMDTHRVSLLTPGTYYADGQIQDEDYEYGSFSQSKMYAAGVTCTDCHDPHTSKTLPGNGACAKCHDPARFDVPAHHHHAAGSTCTSCHMPTTTYMVVHARHDHGFKVPRPDLSAKTGAPNVCARCHPDQPSRWWWRPKPPHWSETIAGGRADPMAAAPALAALIGDGTQPAIVRATALTLTRDVRVEAAALADRDPLVRDAAVLTLAEAPPATRGPLLAPLASDPIRTVRIDAGRALVGTPDAPRGASALEEWKRSQQDEADRPEAHLNLCALDEELGDLDAADRECRAAIRITPRSPAGYVNLADVHRAAGREADVDATLRAGLAVAPDSAALWHALGLALVRQRRPEEALEALHKATQLEPGDARFAEVYRIAKSELSSP